MTKIIVPILEPGMGVCFRKFALREASAISVASASVMIKTDGKVCTDSCIVVGAVAPIPTISEKASNLLNGCKLREFEKDGPIFNEVGDEAVKDSLPIDDIRGSAMFRRDIVKVIIQRAVFTAVLRAKESLKK